ncbi:helix-turn-helix domain-containing protein [Streptomyces sp. NPDC005890]|uniref:helix-turn-helix domain-containing protein n=1 Tax=Streptomyces sp. NPDC005890 TaxID=3154568 RepID=UPI0033CA2827
MSALRVRNVLRRFQRPAPASEWRPDGPLWVRGLTAGGRPIVLGVALLMCAPGEYHLAHNAGWGDPFTYGMPVVLSAYAGIAAAVASTRRRGDRGRWSAIIGAFLALSLAMAAQVVSHLISTRHLVADQPLLIAITSLVPPAVVGHLLHLAATPSDARQDAQDTKAEGASSPVPAPSPFPVVAPAGARLLPLVARPAPSSARSTVDFPVVAPAGARILPLVPRPRPTVTLEREDTQDALRTLELEPGTDEDAEDGPRPEPPLMTSNDVADHYGIKPSTLRNWVAAGRIPVHSKDASGRNLFHPEQLPTFYAMPMPAASGRR